MNLYEAMESVSEQTAGSMWCYCPECGKKMDKYAQVWKYIDSKIVWPKCKECEAPK